MRKRKVFAIGNTPSLTFDTLSHIYGTNDRRDEYCKSI